MDGKQQPPAYSGQQQVFPAQQQPYPGQPQQPYPGQQQQQQPYPGQPLQPYPAQAQQPYPGQPAQSVVVVTNTVSGNPATSYLGFAIFTCLCCCWPIGIAAIIFAVRTNDENGRGNYGAAQSSSKVALWCSVAALVFGSIWLIIVIAMAATGNLVTHRYRYRYNYG